MSSHDEVIRKCVQDIKGIIPYLLPQRKEEPCQTSKLCTKEPSTGKDRRWKNG